MTTKIYTISDSTTEDMPACIFCGTDKDIRLWRKDGLTECKSASKCLKRQMNPVVAK